MNEKFTLTNKRSRYESEVINDRSCYDNSKASDYYFYVDFDELRGRHDYLIANRSFWDAENCLDNELYIGDLIKSFLPGNFSERTESCFIFNGTKEDGILALKNAGFIQIENS